MRGLFNLPGKLLAASLLSLTLLAAAFILNGVPSNSRSQVAAVNASLPESPGTSSTNSSAAATSTTAQSIANIQAELATLRNAIKDLKSTQAVTVSGTPSLSATLSATPVTRIISSGVSRDDLSGVENSLRAEIARVASYATTQSAGNFAAIALTQRIDNLNNVTIGNASISGSRITNSTFEGTILTASSGSFTSLSAGVTTLATTTVAGDVMLSGILTANTKAMAPFFVATDALATSTFAGRLTVTGSASFENGAFTTYNGNQFRFYDVLSFGWSNKEGPNYIKPAAGDNLSMEIGASTLSSASGYLYLQTQGMTRLHLAKDGTVVANNNVGIGTSTPWARLAVTGTSTDATNALLVANSNNVPLFNVLNNGNVGIGTTSPGAKLDVWNNAGYQLRLSNDTTHYAQLEATSLGDLWISPSTGFSFFYDGVSAEQVNIYNGQTGAIKLNSGGNSYLNGGNVGIGTTTPWGQLSVNPNGITGPSFAIGSSTKTDFVVTSGGNVGIGTASPSVSLQVEKAGVGLGASIQLSNSATDAIGNYTEIGFATAGNNQVRLRSLRTTGSGSDALFFTRTAVGNESEKVRITSEGNVGIGTTSPWRTLSVTGTVGFDGVAGSTGTGSLCLDANKQVVFNSGSDACLSSTRATKHDISTLTLSGTSTVSALEPVSFIYNNDASSTVRFGFIAEDAAAVDSRLATHDVSGAISGIDDRSIIAILVKAVQELIAEVRSVAAAVAGFAQEFTTNVLTAATGNFTHVKTQDLCVGQTCITESQFNTLLQSGGTQPASAITAETPISSPATDTATTTTSSTDATTPPRRARRPP